MKEFKSRKNTRLKNYDYTQQGAYYVTACVNNREPLFGDIENDVMVLNDTGRMVEFTWIDLTRHNENIELDKFIVMPNHIHGIINIVGAGSKPALKPIIKGRVWNPPLRSQKLRQNHMLIYNDGNECNENITNNKRAGLEPAPTTHGLCEIVRQFKTFSATRINQINKTPNACLWQRNYYEHVIRDERDLNRIHDYITNNPVDWAIDEENQINYKRRFDHYGNK